MHHGLAGCQYSLIRYVYLEGFLGKYIKLSLLRILMIFIWDNLNYIVAKNFIISNMIISNTTNQ